VSAVVELDQVIANIQPLGTQSKSTFLSIINLQEGYGIIFVVSM
jgi:hypothetical protein